MSNHLINDKGQGEKISSSPRFNMQVIRFEHQLKSDRIYVQLDGIDLQGHPYTRWIDVTRAVLRLNARSLIKLVKEPDAALSLLYKASEPGSRWNFSDTDRLAVMDSLTAFFRRRAPNLDLERAISWTIDKARVDFEKPG